MNLPQEYWRKTTLFEIASGLGTSLAIDESTLSRRFGIFARDLVDVDLSEQLFNTVVVERDESALSIDVVYEKQPSFCANCKSLGHSLQNCMKLNHTNAMEVPTRMPNKYDQNGKKEVATGLSDKNHASRPSKATKAATGKKHSGLDTHGKKHNVTEIFNVEISPLPLFIRRHLNLKWYTLTLSWSVNPIILSRI
jgi:hypothetical protein